MDLDALVKRVRGEFVEMPGLRLSVPQAMRLWALEQDDCKRVIEALVRAEFLRHTSKGEIVRQ